MLSKLTSWLKKILGGGPPDSAGVRGEKLAADFLRRERGMTIVARNWRSPHDRRDEIDLVCRDGEALVFVEVKTRSAAALVPGVHAVNTRKKTVLRRAAKAYLSYLQEKPRTFRLDVVEVALPVAAKGGASKGGADTAAKLQPEILHFENVGMFSKYDQG